MADHPCDLGPPLVVALDPEEADAAYRTFAFGDSENDLPMMRVVDHPVAMGNALDSVKQAASYVTASVQEDGVPAALRHFGLI